MCPILTSTITLERLAKRGYESMLDYYRKSFLNYRIRGYLLHSEPPYTRSVRSVVLEAHPNGDSGRAVYSMCRSPSSLSCWFGVIY
jgi:hypothetical protein